MAQKSKKIKRNNRQEGVNGVKIQEQEKDSIVNDYGDKVKDKDKDIYKDDVEYEEDDKVQVEGDDNDRKGKQVVVEYNLPVVILLLPSY